MTCSISAQNIKRPDSYNWHNRGVEAIQNNNAEEALEYFNNKELEDNPNNGYALAWIATVRNYQEEYGRAQPPRFGNKAYSKKDKQYRAFAYIVRAESYVGLGENGKSTCRFHIRHKRNS